eukprot:358893-Chlamydomonas_euryale.AAC.1
MQVLHAMLTTAAADTCPRNSEARRIVATFLNSLSLHSLPACASLLETRSLTVLTPLYCEEVLYCLDGGPAARALMGGGGASGGGAAGTRGGGNAAAAADVDAAGAAAATLPDLLTEPGGSGEGSGGDGGGGGRGGGSAAHGVPSSRSGSSDGSRGVSLLTYLRSVYPREWDNFRQRMCRIAAAAAVAQPAGGWEAVSERDFQAGGPLEPWALDLQLWASYRAQV